MIIDRKVIIRKDIAQENKNLELKT